MYITLANFHVLCDLTEKLAVEAALLACTHTPEPSIFRSSLLPEDGVALPPWLCSRAREEQQNSLRVKTLYP